MMGFKSRHTPLKTGPQPQSEKNRKPDEERFIKQKLKNDRKCAHKTHLQGTIVIVIVLKQISFTHIYLQSSHSFLYSLAEPPTYQSAAPPPAHPLSCSKTKFFLLSISFVKSRQPRPSGGSARTHSPQDQLPTSNLYLNY